MILKVKNLIKRYGELLAVDNVNLSLREGEILGLLGPNGAGKTTLINSIIGITSIQSGDIEIFEMDIKEKLSLIKKKIGVVPQNLAIYDDLKAIENINFFARLYGLRGTTLNKKVQEALEFTNLWERRKEYPGQFSGGMKRRLNIACSIVHQPELLILDEPTVGIDPQSRNHILESVRELNRRGTSIIYTSHYMEEVEALCSRIAIMDNGRLIAEGSKAELKEYVQEEVIINIRVSNPSYSIVDNVLTLEGVKEANFQGDNLIVIMEQHNSISKLINTINDNGTDILNISMEQASMEDVFLTLTGKTLRE
ncbi:ABC transporter ATP-binding protein [Natronospora cellulosivora (SeqCode)]